MMYSTSQKSTVSPFHVRTYVCVRELRAASDGLPLPGFVHLCIVPVLTNGIDSLAHQNGMVSETFF